jgi:Raf kinase inhibitor-like YbhB/YbcL family protein
MLNVRSAPVFAALLAAVIACGSDDSSTLAAGAGAAGAAAPAGGMFALTSSAFMNGGTLPMKYRCTNLTADASPSPPLSWTPGPAGTMSYAILMKDTTGATAGLKHWVIYDIPASVNELPENVMRGAMPPIPAGAKQISNDLSATGYLGPCAKMGTNTYQFTIYALSAAMVSGINMAFSIMQVEGVLEPLKLATATLSVNSMP